MTSQENLRALANDNPEMLRAYQQAIHAVLEYRLEVSAIRPSLRITTRFKKKQFAATRKLIRFADIIVLNSLLLSQENKKLVRHWVAVAAP